MGTEPLLHLGVSFGMCLLPEVCLQPPLLPGLELPVLCGEETLHLPAEYHHSWAEGGERIDCDPVFQ